MAGPIPPDGRPPQPPGVGAQARRHDLETPATPGLAGDSMQYGDVQRLERGLQQVPITRMRKPGAGRKRNVNNLSGQPVSDLARGADPIEMAIRKAGGTLDPSVTSERPQHPNTNEYMHFLRQMMMLPGASAPFTRFYIESVQHWLNEGSPPSAVINFHNLDSYLANRLGVPE